MTLPVWGVTALVVFAVLLVPERAGPRVFARAGAGRAEEPSRRWARARRPPRAEEGDAADLLAFLDVVAPSLRAGRTPEESARLACDVAGDTPLVGRIRQGIAAGRSLDAVFEREATGDADVRLVARAWRLSTRTGCPLAAAVECAARLVRARVAHRRRVRTASAGARATIRVLTVLPVGGPLLAVVVGVDPVRAYVSSPTAWACLMLGGGLTLAGRWWVARLVGAVAHGPVLRAEEGR